MPDTDLGQMFMRKLYLSLFWLMMGGCPLYAQVADGDAQPVVYNQKYVPIGLDNYQSGFYYYNGGKVYTMRSFNVASAANILSLKVNPSGSSYAILDSKKGKNTVFIYDLWKAKNELAKIANGKYQPLAICYSADAKDLFLMGSDGKVHVFDAKSNVEVAAFDASVQANRMAASTNNYYVALAKDNDVEVMNVEARSRRALLQQNAEVKDVAFSANSKWMAVLTADGQCNVYDTRTFQVTYHYEALGAAESCFFHPENKYLAVVTGDQRVAIINLLNEKDRHYVDAQNPGVTYVNFVRNADKGVYLVYNTKNSIVFNPVFFLSPNRQEILKNELESRMAEWMKRMDGESLEDFNARVNDETRMTQMRLFETEIATRMAENLLTTSEVKVGNYNQEMGMLTLDFNTMPSIYLSVPAAQLDDFMDPGALQFSNTKYCVNDKDEFELVYTEVTNPKTGNKYVFDNRERKSLAFLESDENFVPFAQLQTSQMEELKLEEIKNNILKNAKDKNIISDHTSIDVRTKVANATDAAGKKVTNYEVAVSYTVDEAFSSKDDFAAGKFKCEDSKAAQAMLAVVKQALENDLSKYMVAGKQVKVMVTGMADATPFSRTVAYDGCYGDFEREPVYKDGALSNITVTKATGMSDNDQLAFLRAMGVKDFIVKNIPSLSNMKTSFDTSIDVSKKSGSQYRRIGVQFTFMDAF